jgi:hypothetical protein
MKRFFKWRHWRASSKFWRKRALKAEAALEAEVVRNREREDTLVTVPMRLGGLWGMPARSAPAVRQVNVPPQLTQSTDPWDGLSWADKQEYEMFWKADAVAAGIPEQQARQQFLMELQTRRTPINDEPYATN